MSARALLVLALAVPPGLGAQATCGDRAWPSIGVGAYHCPGRTCAFTAPHGTEPAAFAFSSEPWLRSIDPTGPAVGRIEEGDVLVAVNGLLITTSPGGAALARLDPNREAELALRRAGRLVEVRVRPRASCRAPLILIGNAMVVSGDARSGALRRSAAADPSIDFTAAQRLSETAFDAGLGMTLRCPGCVVLARGDETRWAVTSFPIVEYVARGGVADEAGLAPGDEVRRIDGRDVRHPDGDSPLFAPPRGDFTIDYVRDGRPGSAFMNRRIVDQRIVIRGQRGVQVERTEGLGDRLLGALAGVWRVLTNLAADGPPPRIIVHGETWGPDGLGLLFRSDSAMLFVLDDVNGRQVLRFPAPPVVATVAEGGPGARAGLAPGDAITHVDGRSVLDSDGATPLIHTDAGHPLAVTYLRAGRTHHTTLIPSEER
jgi:hypothetical protein